jgi:hypothetical protein
MKFTSVLLLAGFACGAAFAQTPMPSPSGNARPPAETNPNASGGVAQARAGAKTDAKVAMGGDTAMMGNKAMDTNGDGMISQKEWNAYHGGMWKKMKANKQGMVPWSDVDTSMRGQFGGQGGTPK